MVKSLLKGVKEECLEIWDIEVELVNGIFTMRAWAKP